MATLKAVVMKHQKRRDGKFPVSIRICKGGVSSYMSTEFYVNSQQVNRKTFDIKDSFVIERTNKTICDMERRMLLLSDEELRSMSSKDLKIMFEASRKSVDYFEEFREMIKTKSKGTADNYVKAYNRLKRICNSETLPIIQFNSVLINNFVDDMQQSRLSNYYINGEVSKLKHVFSYIQDKYNTEFAVYG
jgi:hypothetical protein